MFNKTRRPLAVFVSALIAFVLMLGTIASLASTVNTSFAADAVVTAKFPREVLCGESFTVKVPTTGTVSVCQPDGTYIKDDGTSSNVKVALTSDTAITAKQKGNYVVTYNVDAGNDYASYTYNIFCYMEYDYKLVVDGEGAALPSVWKKDDAAPKIPAATLYYFDEDEQRYFPTGLKDDPNGKNKVVCYVTAPGAAPVETAFGADLYSGTAVAGTYFVSYEASVLGGDNVISQRYTVQLQSTFDDKKAPSINISGISSTSSINVKNTLPVATLSDDYDERVKAEVTVQHSYNGEMKAVPEVVADLETGYVKTDDSGKVLFYKATSEGGYSYSDGKYETTTNIAEAKTATFDNNSFMYFYPTENGVYKVTYKAIDDSGNESVEHSYNISVSDTTGPVFDNFTAIEIPSKWGEKVYQKDIDNDSVKDELTDTKVVFPIPEVFDNASASSDITCSFTVTDPKSRQIIYVENILETESNDKSKVVVTATGAPTDYYFVNGTASKNLKDGINLKDFMYEQDYIGSYTIKYVAKDSQGNTASTTKELSFRSEFTDEISPTVSIEVPAYFAFRNYKTYESVTDISATDDNSANLDVEYYVTIDGVQYDLDYKAGSTDFLLQIKNNKKHIEFQDVNEKVIKVDIEADSIDFVLKATDDVGNVSDVLNKNVKLIDSSVSTWGVDPVVVETGDTSTDANGYYNFGSFTIDFANVDNREYTGFEIYVQQVESNGKIVDKDPLTNVEFDYYSDNSARSTTKLYVKNIKFKVSLAGKYMVVIKGLNVAGDSSLYTKVVDITLGSSTEYGKVTANISSSIELGTAYDLNNNYYSDATDPVTVLRHIKGGRMSIMGTEFTALQDCGYIFEDYIIKYSELDANNLDQYESKAGAYSTSASVSETPVFEVLGVMPLHVEKNATTPVVLPAISAYTTTANATKITCKVTDCDGNSIAVKDCTNDATLMPNQFSFLATKDGDYTVSYTATVNDKQNSTSYTITCGDVQAPEFSVEIGSINGSLKKAADGSPDATVGQTFNYAKITYLDEDTDGYTCSKTLISPEGEEVAESKVTTTDSANNGTAYELNIAGTYTVVYTVTDNVGNTTTIKYYINVTNSTSNVSSEAIQTLTIVLIIVGVIIIAGVIIYLVRFRKRKA